MQRTLSLVIPEGLVVLLTALLARFGERIEGFDVLATWLPPLVLGAGALIALRFGRGRLVWGLVAVAPFWAWGALGAPGGGWGPVLLSGSALVLLAVAGTRERGMADLRAGHPAALGLLVAGLLALAQWRLDPAELLPDLSSLAGDLSWSGLPATAALVVVGILLVLVALALFRADPLVRGALWALVALWGATVLAARAPTLVLVAGAGAALTTGALEAIFSAAFRDALTGLPSRRALDEHLSGLPADAVVAMVDVDHFKQFNDTYGHATGDQVLAMVGRRLAEVGGARAFRYGGEEFTLVFAGRPVDDVVPVLERLREAIAATTFTVRAPDRPAGKRGKARRGAGGGTVTLGVTVSIGVAVRGAAETPGALVARADAALYAAKKGGRDRVSLAAGRA